MKIVQRVWFGLAALIVAGQGTAHAGIDECHAIGAEHRNLRLDCYDRVTGYKPPAEAAPAGLRYPDAPPRTHLEAHWGLNRSNIPLGDEPLSHKPTYVVARVSGTPNEWPSSPTLGRATPTPEQLDDMELKFQLSFKAEAVSPRQFRALGNWLPDALAIPWEDLRLWVAYTQQSNWQISNAARSRPFRSNDYEPEAILSYNNRDAVWMPRLVNLGYVHHSNGRGGPESRSWDRWYVQGGWDVTSARWGELSILARKWWRIPEDPLDDDNPDIEDYYGRADLQLRWAPNERHKLALLLRHNLRTSPGRGFAQLDWSTPLTVGPARLHIQATTGYGESLIDYNHKQKTLGLGLSFGLW